MPSLTKDLIISQTRTELIETGTTSGQWDDVEIAEFAQEANEELQDLAEQEEEATAVTIAGQETVDYPATVATIQRIWSRPQGSTQSWIKLRKADPDERHPDDGTQGYRGKPIAYQIFNDKIYLMPIPDAVYDLNIWGYKAASDLVNGAGTTLPLFSSKYHVLVKLYAIARCKQKMDDPGYQNYDGQYLAGVLSFRKWKLQQKHKEGPRMVKMVTGMWD